MDVFMRVKCPACRWLWERSGEAAELLPLAGAAARVHQESAEVVTGDPLHRPWAEVTRSLTFDELLRS